MNKICILMIGIISLLGSCSLSSSGNRESPESIENIEPISMKEIGFCEQDNDCIIIEVKPYGCGGNTRLPINKIFSDRVFEINKIIPKRPKTCNNVKVTIITPTMIPTCYNNTCQATYKN